MTEGGRSLTPQGAAPPSRTGRRAAVKVVDCQTACQVDWRRGQVARKGELDARPVIGSRGAAGDGLSW